MYYLTNLMFLGIPLLYYYISFRSSIICLFYGDIYLSFGLCLSNPIFPISLSTVFELFCGDVFVTFVILSVILLPNKSPFFWAVLLTILFEAVLSASAADYLAWSKCFRLYLPLTFLLIFLPIFYSYFSQITKIQKSLQTYNF